MNTWNAFQIFGTFGLVVAASAAAVGLTAKKLNNRIMAK